MKSKSSIQGIALMLIALKAPAQVAFTSTGNFDGWIVIFSGQAFGVSWTQAIPYENVSISVDFTAFGQSAETGRAFLSTSIGTGASIADQVAYTAFTFPSAENDVVLFSGLNLPSGQYYLSLVGDSSSWGSGWIVSDSPTIAIGPGVTLGSSYGFTSPSLSYLPASSVYDGGSIPNFTVTGTAIPEASTYGIYAAITALLIAFSKRRNRK